MGTLYTSQAAAGYNSSPPPDDGSQGANNQITWGTTIKAKLADPIKALADAINSQLTTALDLSPRAISTPDSAVASDHWRTLQVTGTTTITLSDAATMTNKYVVGVANLGVGTVTVTRATGANTINGTAADFTLPPKSAIVLGVNNAANGYNIISSTGGNSNNTSLVATTSVVTPLVATGSDAQIGVGVNGIARWAIPTSADVSNFGWFPTSDNASDLGKASARVRAVFTPIIDSGTTGSLSLKTNNGSTQLAFDHVASVNSHGMQGGAAGQPVLLYNKGETNVGVTYVTKGIGGFSWNTGSTADVPTSSITQFQVLHTASAARSITVTGAAAGGNPTIAATAGSPAISYPSAGGSGTPTSNVLTMYEEGTWVPSLGGSATYTLQEATYTKVGRQVSFRGRLTVNAIGTGSTASISGLPFTNAIECAVTVQIESASATSVVSVTGVINGSGTIIVIRSRTAASTSDTGNAVFQNGTVSRFSGTYFV